MNLLCGDEPSCAATSSDEYKAMSAPAMNFLVRDEIGLTRTQYKTLLAISLSAAVISRR